MSHPMSNDQAGAVAALDALVAEIRLEARDGAEAGEDMSVQRDWANRIARVRRKIAAPPAAVSVEALEGLVAKLMLRAEVDKMQCTNDDGSYRSDSHRAAWNFADGLEYVAYELTRLIKERSNV